jgi:hypothetical protein
MQQRTLWLLAIAVLALLGVLQIYCIVQQHHPERIYFSQDQALTLSIADATIEGELPLLGSPSHVRGRHLGPAYNWYLGALWWLTDRSIEWTFFIDALLKCFSVVAIALLAALMTRSSSRIWSFIGVSAAALAGHYPTVLSQQWQNNTLFLALSVLYLLTYLRIRGVAVPWGLLALFATLTVQTHFSTIPLIALWGLTLFLLHWWPNDGITGDPLAQRIGGLLSGKLLKLGSWLLSVLLWLPVLYFEVHYSSNLLAVAEGLFGKKEPAGLLAAIRTFTDLLELYLFGAVSADATRYFSWTLIVPLLLALAVLLFQFLREASRADKIWVFTLGIAVVGFITAVARQAPPSHVYYFSAILPLPLLIAGVAVPRAIGWLHHQRVFQRIIAVVTVSYFGLIWFGSISENLDRASRTSLPAVTSLRHVREFADRFQKLSAPDGSGLLTVEARSSQSSMRDPYYFLLGPPYRSRIKYAELLVEQASLLSGPPVGATTVVLSCPRPEGKHRENLFRELVTRSPSFHPFSLAGLYGESDCGAWVLPSGGGER